MSHLDLEFLAKSDCFVEIRVLGPNLDLSLFVVKQKEGVGRDVMVQVLEINSSFNDTDEAFRGLDGFDRFGQF